MPTIAELFTAHDEGGGTATFEDPRNVERGFEVDVLVDVFHDQNGGVEPYSVRVSYLIAETGQPIALEDAQEAIEGAIGVHVSRPDALADGELWVGDVLGVPGEMELDVVMGLFEKRAQHFASWVARSGMPVRAHSS